MNVLGRSAKTLDSRLVVQYLTWADAETFNSLILYIGYVRLELLQWS